MAGSTSTARTPEDSPVNCGAATVSRRNSSPTSGPDTYESWPTEFEAMDGWVYFVPRKPTRSVGVVAQQRCDHRACRRHLARGLPGTRPRRAMGLMAVRSRSDGRLGVLQRLHMGNRRGTLAYRWRQHRNRGGSRRRGFAEPVLHGAHGRLGVLRFGSGTGRRRCGGRTGRVNDEVVSVAVTSDLEALDGTLFFAAYHDLFGAEVVGEQRGGCGLDGR